MYRYTISVNIRVRAVACGVSTLESLTKRLGEGITRGHVRTDPVVCAATGEVRRVGLPHVHVRPTSRIAAWGSCRLRIHARRGCQGRHRVCGASSRRNSARRSGGLVNRRSSQRDRARERARDAPSCAGVRGGGDRVCGDSCLGLWLTPVVVAGPFSLRLGG